MQYSPYISPISREGCQSSKRHHLHGASNSISLKTMGILTQNKFDVSPLEILSMNSCLSFANMIPMFHGPSSQLHEFVIRCKRCRENIAAPVETMPDTWIIHTRPLCGERRRYPPAETSGVDVRSIGKVENVPWGSRWAGTPNVRIGAKLGPSLLIATCLILAIRTAKGPPISDKSTADPEMDREIHFAIHLARRVLSALVSKSEILSAKARRLVSAQWRGCSEVNSLQSADNPKRFGNSSSASSSHSLSRSRFRITACAVVTNAGPINRRIAEAFSISATSMAWRLNLLRITTRRRAPRSLSSSGMNSSARARCR